MDKSAPKIGNKRIYSSNVDPAKAGLGDTVFVEFTASEKVTIVDATIGGQPIDGHEDLSDLTSRVWRLITGADTEGILSFSLAGGDVAGNMSAATSTVFDGSKVEFSRGGLSILLTRITSNGSYGDTLSKPGDEISVEITSDMPLIVNTATISGQTAAVQDVGENKYLFSIVGADQDQAGLAQFEIDYTDANALPYEKITAVTDASYVRYYGTRPLFGEVTIAASGANQAIASVNDTIQLTFRLQDGLFDSEVNILNKKPESIAALGQDTYRASYVLTENDTEGQVEFNITASDLAGESESINTTTNNSYVIFDQSPPADFTVGQVSTSGGTVVENQWNGNNQNVLVTVPIDNDLSLIGGGVQVLVSFDGSDTLEIGTAAAITEDNVGNSIVVTLSQDEFKTAQSFAVGATALFTAQIKDIAGYTKIGTPSNNQLLINKAEEKSSIVENIAMATSNKSFPNGAKAGDVSSGVEKQPGVKCVEKIQSFIQAVKGA